MTRIFGKAACPLFTFCFLALQSCGEKEPGSALDEPSVADPESRISAIAESLVVTARSEGGETTVSSGVAVSLESFGGSGVDSSRNREHLAFFPPDLGEVEKGLLAELAGPDLAFSERIKFSKISGSLVEKFAILEGRLPYEFRPDPVVFSDTVPDPGAKITFLRAVIDEESSVSQKREGSFAYKLSRTDGVIVATGEEDCVEVEFAPDEGTPEGASHVAIASDGTLIGLVPKGGNSFRLDLMSGLQKLAAPEIRSLGFVLEEVRAEDDRFSIRLDLDVWVGFGWKTLDAVILPPETVNATTSGDDVVGGPIFDPDRLPPMHDSERIEQSNSFSFRDAIEIQSGESVSLVGQVFAKDGDGRIEYFEPFHWTVDRSPSGRIFRSDFEEHPFASVAAPPEFEGDLQDSMDVSEPLVLNYEGNVIQASPTGSGDDILLQTNRAPYLLNLNVREQTLSPHPIPGKRSDLSDLYVTAGGGHIFILNAKASMIEKWSYDAKTLVAERKLPEGDEYHAIAVAASRPSAPVMIVSEKTVQFCSQGDLSPITRKYAPMEAREEYFRDTFEYVYGFPKGDKVTARASADGLSYFVRNISIRENSMTEETVLFRPFEDANCFRHIQKCDLLDLGINGNILFEGSGAYRHKFDRLLRYVDGKLLGCNWGGDGYFTIESRSFNHVPVIPGNRHTVRFFVPDVEEPIFASDSLAELGLLEANEGYPPLMFFPEKRQLVAIPATGEEVIFRTMELTMDVPVRVISSEKLTVTRGEKSIHQLSFLNEPEEASMMKGPLGATFDAEKYRVTLDLGLDFTGDRAVCKFEFKNKFGTTTEHKVTVSISGPMPSLLSIEDPWGSGRAHKGGVRKVQFKGVVSKVISMDERIADIVAVHGGDIFAIYTFDDSRLHILDTKAAEIRASERLPGDYAMITGNREAIFCYYPSHGVIERRNASDLKLEKTISLERECILRMFDTAHLAEDSTPIVCVQQGDTRDVNDRVRFLDPASLEFLDSDLEKAFLRASSYQLPVCRGVSNHLSLSEDGTMIMIANNVIRFDRTSAEHVSSVQDSHDQEMSLSSHTGALLISAIQHQIKAGTKIDRAPSDLDFFKFDLEGDNVIGFDIAKQYLSPRTAQVLFFSPGMQRPDLYAHNLSEFDQGKTNFRQLRDNSVMGEHQRIFYSSANGTLVTVPWGNRSVVIRRIDLEEVKALLE